MHAQAMQHINDKSMDGLTYESLLQKLLMKDEQIAYHDHLTFVALQRLSDSGAPVAGPEGEPKSLSGRAVLTNKRLLLLSSQPTYSSKFEPVLVAPDGRASQYSLTYEAIESAWFEPLLLQDMRTLKFTVKEGVTAQNTVYAEEIPPPCCNALCGMCLCMCPAKTNWHRNAVSESVQNERVVYLGSTIPPRHQELIVYK